jgi:preprotein translocase subunit SecD
VLQFRRLAEPGATDVDMLESRDAGGQRVPVERRVVVTGEQLVDASPGFDQRTNEPIVNFRFSVAGGQRFGQVTTENVGRALAIVLDNVVISSPRILSPITGGSGQISGRFTVQAANDLAVLLRAGALPAKLTIVEERTVGPGLGADSIEAGRTAAYISALLVCGLMFAIYGLFGFFANFALIVHIGLIFGIMSAMQATLTLPGIAGIVLTIGTAVDSNRLQPGLLDDPGFEPHHPDRRGDPVPHRLRADPGLRAHAGDRHPHDRDHRRDPDAPHDRHVVPDRTPEGAALLRSRLPRAARK